MLLNNQKIGCVPKLSAWDFPITAGKRDDAKREWAALSSLPVRTRGESNRLTSDLKSRSLGLACTNHSRLWMPSAAFGGEGVLPSLSSTGCSGDGLRKGLCEQLAMPGVIPARLDKHRSLFKAAAHT